MAGDRREPAVAINLGYLFGILLPPVGIAIGLALIAEGDPDGPWIVGYGVTLTFVYGILAVLFLLG
jgi:hypothetical protein